MCMSVQPAMAWGPRRSASPPVSLCNVSVRKEYRSGCTCFLFFFRVVGSGGGGGGGGCVVCRAHGLMPVPVSIFEVCEGEVG